MLFLRHSCSWCASLGQKTWLCMSFQVRGFRRASLLLMSPPPYCHPPTVYQNQWHEMGIVSLYHVLGLPLIWVFHYMPRLPSGDYGTWPGSWSCYCCRYAWCYTVAWLPGIGIGQGILYIGFRNRASLVSSYTQWGIGLSLPSGSWRPMNTLL